MPKQPSTEIALTSMESNRATAATADPVDRRRAARRNLHPSATVKLALWPESRDEHAFMGALLNLSPMGLACRVEESWNDALAKNVPVQATFQVRPGAQRFEVVGRVVSSTPGAEPGYSIIGIEFQFDEQALGTKRMLERALAVGGG